MVPVPGKARGLQKEEWTIGGERRTLVGCLPGTWIREPAPRELAVTLGIRGLENSVTRHRRGALSSAWTGGLRVE